MSPERKAIIEAIKTGYQTPYEIGQKLGKETKTVSKLLYVMTKNGLIKRMQGGKYVLEKSINNVDNQIELSMVSVDKLPHTQTIKSLDNLDTLMANAMQQFKDILKQQYGSSNTVDNTDLQAKLEKVQFDLDMREKNNVQLRALLDKTRTEKNVLSNHNNELLEQLEAKQKALALLVFLVTTGKIGKMLSNIELGQLIDLNSSDVAGLKRKAKKYLQ